MTTEEERARLAVIEKMIGGVINMAAAIPLHDVEDLSRAMAHQDAFMPFYDPTGWMRQHEAMRVGRDLVEAFLVFRRAIEKGKQDERARQETARNRPR